MIFQVNRRYRLFKRYQNIVNVFIKHGLGYLITRFNLTRFVPFSKRFAPELMEVDPREQTLAFKLRSALQDLGPTFIKFGQLLSTRPDILPAAYTAELKGLQDDTPLDSFDYVLATLEKELGGEVKNYFQSVDEIPIGSGSMSQAHRAVLVTGEHVIVKVLHRNIEKIVADDLEVFYGLAKLVTQHRPEMEIYDLPRLVEEFERYIMREMDLQTEGRNCETFRTHFLEEERVVFPKVYWDMTRKRVLTIETMDGIKITDAKHLREHGLDPIKLMKIGAEVFAKMVLEHGFFHGDPHPGNLFVLEDGRLCFIDFGITGILSPDMQRKLTALMAGAVFQDSPLVIRTLFRMDVLPETFDSSAFRIELDQLFSEINHLKLGEIEIGHLIFDLMKLATRYRVKLPANFSLLSKSFLTIEGIGRELDPDFLLIPFIRPYLIDFLRTRLFAPEHLLQELAHFLDDSQSLIRDFPHRFHSIMRKLERGTLSLEYHHKGLEPLINRMDTASSRLSVSLVLAAMIISSSLMIMVGGGPEVMEVPIFGIVGYGVSFFLGLFLTISVIRSGRL